MVIFNFSISVTVFGVANVGVANFTVANVAVAAGGFGVGFEVGVGDD